MTFCMGRPGSKDLTPALWRKRIGIVCLVSFTTIRRVFLGADRGADASSCGGESPAEYQFGWPGSFSFPIHHSTFARIFHLFLASMVTDSYLGFSG